MLRRLLVGIVATAALGCGTRKAPLETPKQFARCAVPAEVPRPGTYRLTVRAIHDSEPFARGWLVVDTVPLPWFALSDTARILAMRSARGDLGPHTACYSLSNTIQGFGVVAGTFAPYLATPDSGQDGEGHHLEVEVNGNSLCGILHIWSRSHLGHLQSEGDGWLGVEGVAEGPPDVTRCEAYAGQ